MPYQMREAFLRLLNDTYDQMATWHRGFRKGKKKTFVNLVKQEAVQP